MARRMLSSSRTAANGFSTKSAAPACMARTAIGTSAWPVMMTTGTPRRSPPSALEQGQAVHSGHADVEQHAGGTWRVEAPQKVLGGAEGAVSKPSADSSASSESRTAGVVVDDVDPSPRERSWSAASP